METRNESFQRLKPACVALSQATLTFSVAKQNGREVTACLEDLAKVVLELSQRPDHLDHKLADYVFYPISQVLKASRELPVRAMELCLQCLAVLIEQGWRDRIDPSLSSQLVIFLSLTCDKSGKTVAVSQGTDELRLAAFTCMSKLFEALSLDTANKSSLVATANVPSLGHAISVILDGVLDGESVEIQISATDALFALLRCIEDVEVLSSFFPGIVSVLTKVLTPNTKDRRSWKVLALSLRILDRLFLALLSDTIVATLPEMDSEAKQGETTKQLSASWVKATAAQVKVALANIERLRSHSRPEVREALADLNLTILTSCSTALKSCCQMALESSLIIFDTDLTAGYAGKARLESLVRSNSLISQSLASVYHDELLSLTRVMQSNDDQAKERTLKLIFSALGVLANTEVDMRLISRMLATGLRESVTAVLKSSSDSTLISQQENSVVLSDLPQLEGKGSMSTFTAPLVRYKGQSTLLNIIQTQLEAAKASQVPLSIAPELVSEIRQSQGDAQVACYWLVLRDLEAGGTSDVLKDLLWLDDTSESQDGSTMDQIYSLALDVMADSDADWRLKTLALESIALQAKQYKEDFRGELVDALYPVLHHLGSDVPQVRSHAITCLNIVSDACGYADVKELILSNVDYLVNAVALKLNAFDVSPQGPQVLLMMVRLAGSSLLPYLEDSLESIFAALEDYHGYPTLVALLFAVLKAIAEEGVKSPQLQITDTESTVNNVVNAWIPITMQGLLAKIKNLATQPEADVSAVLPDKVPNQPWKQLNSSFEQAEADIRLNQEKEDGASDDDEPAAVERPPPPAPKTFALLLKITTLTQHYLSSSSASLRISLLALIRTTIPALAKHEDSYLPLINTLWSEITSRLFDDEPSVVAASLQIIGTICEYGGEFTRSRITSLWPELKSLYRRISRDIKSHHGRESASATSGDLMLRQTSVGYVDVSSKAVWQSLLDLLKTVVKHVGIEADIFEELLSMLQPLDRLDPDMKAVLEEYNADAVWLAQYRTGSCALERTRVESSGSWHFVELVQ